MISGSITNTSRGAEVGSNRSGAGYDRPIGCRRNQKQFTSMLISEFFLQVAFLKQKRPLCYFQGLPRWHSGKESACNAGDLGSIPGSERSSEEGNGYSHQYSCLEKSVDKEAGRATVHGFTKSQTQLSN